MKSQFIRTVVVCITMIGMGSIASYAQFSYQEAGERFIFDTLNEYQNEEDDFLSVENSFFIISGEQPFEGWEEVYLQEGSSFVTSRAMDDLDDTKGIGNDDNAPIGDATFFLAFLVLVYSLVRSYRKKTISKSVPTQPNDF